jgi:hypothetical protein
MMHLKISKHTGPSVEIIIDTIINRHRSIDHQVSEHSTPRMYIKLAKSVWLLVSREVGAIEHDHTQTLPHLHTT